MDVVVFLGGLGVAFGVLRWIWCGFNRCSLDSALISVSCKRSGVDFCVVLWIWCGFRCCSLDLAWTSLFFA